MLDESGKGLVERQLKTVTVNLERVRQSLEELRDLLPEDRPPADGTVHRWRMGEVELVLELSGRGRGQAARHFDDLDINVSHLVILAAEGDTSLAVALDELRSYRTLCRSWALPAALPEWLAQCRPSAIQRGFFAQHAFPMSPGTPEAWALSAIQFSAISGDRLSLIAPDRPDPAAKPQRRRVHRPFEGGGRVARPVSGRLSVVDRLRHRRLPVR